MNERRCPSSARSPLEVIASLIQPSHHLHPTEMIAQVEKLVARQQRRRETCRINQRRYRERKKKREAQTQEQVDALRRQLEELGRQKDRLQSSLLTVVGTRSQSQGRIASEYATLFRYGSSTTNFNAQMNFLHQNFAPGFRLQDGQDSGGRDFLVTQWTRYTKLFPKILAAKKIVLIGDTNVDVARISFDCSLPITRCALRLLFPHVFEDEELVQELLGKCLQYELIQVIYFDNSNKVERMHVQYDLAATWFRILNDVKKTVAVIEDTKISNCLIEVDDSQIDDAIAQDTQLEGEKFPDLSDNSRKFHVDYMLS